MKTALVIGAGLAGASAAVTLSREGFRVVVSEKFPGRYGGMCADFSSNGAKHAFFGPHIFHTNNDDTYDFVKAFTTPVAFSHKVAAMTESGEIVPWPVNRKTIELLYKCSDYAEAEKLWLADKEKAEAVFTGDSFEDKAIRLCGERVYRECIENYTRKQWGVDPKLLDGSLFSRLRFVDNYSELFFEDKYVFMPCGGYSEMVYAMLTSENNIEMDWGAIGPNSNFSAFDIVINTAPCWELLGQEPIPMVKISFCTGVGNDFMRGLSKEGYSVLNLCASDIKYTRITDYGRMSGCAYNNKNVGGELPDENGVPLYPIITRENDARQLKMRAELGKRGIASCGRLGSYSYINMDKAVEDGIATAKRQIWRLAQ